jgi:hypothetical protein
MPHPALGFPVLWVRWRTGPGAVAGVSIEAGSPWPGLGREIPPLQPCADHTHPLVMNPGVEEAAQSAGPGFRLCAFGLRLPVLWGRWRYWTRRPGIVGAPW